MVTEKVIGLTKKKKYVSTFIFTNIQIKISFCLSKLFKAKNLKASPFTRNVCLNNKEASLIFMIIKLIINYNNFYVFFQRHMQF